MVVPLLNMLLSVEHYSKQVQRDRHSTSLTKPRFSADWELTLKAGKFQCSIGMASSTTFWGVLGSVGLLLTANSVLGTYPLERSHCFGFGASRGRRPLGLLFRSWGCSEHVIYHSSIDGHLCERRGRQLPGPRHHRSNVL
jgi:hypothetical protein